MGCPPDPVDVGIWRDNDATRAMNEKYDALGKQMTDSCELLEHIIKLLPENSEVTDILSTVALIDQHQPVQAPSAAYHGLYADAQEASDKREYAARLLKSREHALCILRDSILKLANYCQGTLSLEYRNAINREKQLHLEHREDDRKTWLAWLENQKQSAFYYLSSNKNKNRSRAANHLRKLAASLDAEIDRVNSITAEDLLASRDSFGNNPRDFEINFTLIRS